MKCVDKNYIRIINKMLKLLLKNVVNSSIIIMLRNRIGKYPQETIPSKKGVSSFSHTCGTRLCSSYARKRKRRMHFFCTPSGVQFFVSRGDYIVTPIPTLFVVEYIF